MEIPIDLINQVQISLRRHANLPSDAASPIDLPSSDQATAALDPSPPYLRCRHCNGRLLRGLQSPICVFCGTDAFNGVVPDPINFRTTLGYQWLLDSLALDGSEIVTISDEANNTHRGRNALKVEEFPLSDLLDLEIKWPSELEIFGSRQANEKRVERKSSANLSGVNIESYFGNDEKGTIASNVSKDQSNDGVEVHNNLNLFENVQPSQLDADSNFSVSDWGADFQSAPSGTRTTDSTSFDPFVGSANLSAQMDGVFLSARDSSMDTKGGATSDWFADDPRKNSDVAGPSQAIKMNTDAISSVRKDDEKFTDVDWVQDVRWQSESKKESDGNVDGGDDSFDDWNDYASSQDASNTWKQSTIPADEKTSEMNFDVNFFDTFSQPNLFTGEFSSGNISGEGKASLEGSIADRAADANTIIRGDTDNAHTHDEVSTTEAASKAGDGIVAPSVEENSTHIGVTAPIDELPSDSIIKWPSELENFGSHFPNEKPVQSKSSVDLSGVNIENFFSNEEKGQASNTWAEPLASSNQIYAKDDVEIHNNLKSSENAPPAQPSQPVAPSSDYGSDSDSGWGTDFQSAPSKEKTIEPTSFDPFVGSINFSVHMDEVFGHAKDSSIDAKGGPTTGFASTDSDWFANGQWNSSSLGGSTQEIKMSANVNTINIVENPRSSSSADDWVQDGKWQSDNRKDDNVDDGNDSSDDWNDFASSTTPQDPSSSNTLKQTTIPAGEKTSDMNFFSPVNQSRDINFFDSFSQPDIFFSSPTLLGGNKVSSEAYAIDRTADANIKVRGDSDDVQNGGEVLTAETTSKADDGVVAPSAEADNTDKGQTATKDELWLSDPLDLGIKWPSGLGNFGASLLNEKPVQGKGSVILSEDNMENLFAVKEKGWDSNAFSEPSAPVNQFFPNDNIEVHNNFNLFENAQPSQSSVPATDYESDLSDSGWGTDFQSVPSKTTNAESTLFDPFVGSLNLSARLDELYGPAKASSSDTQSGATAGSTSITSNWFSDDLWNNSKSELSGPTQETNTSPNVNTSSALEDVQSSLSTGVNGNADAGNDSSDDWNDFTSSTTVHDSSSPWKQSTKPADEITSEMNLFSSANQSKLLTGLFP